MYTIMYIQVIYQDLLLFTVWTKDELWRSLMPVVEHLEKSMPRSCALTDMTNARVLCSHQVMSE